MADPAELIRSLRSAVVRMERTNKSHYTYEARVAEVEAHEAALLSALTTASPPAPLPEGWRDIASAPRDGTKLRVLYADGTEEDGVYWQEQGRCCILGPRAGAYSPGWTSTAAGHLPVDDVTHWMPLPAPPSAKDETR